MAKTLIGVADKMNSLDDLYHEIGNVFLRFGIHDVVIDKERAQTQKGDHITVAFVDNAGMPWKLMFYWADYKRFLDKQSYRRTITDIITDIESDLAERGCVLVPNQAFGLVREDRERSQDVLR